jgi:ferredoxin
MSAKSYHPALKILGQPRIAEQPGFDLLRVFGLGALLRWRHSRTLLQAPLFLVSIAMVLHGMFGPALAAKNLATTLTWVQFRGVLVLVILGAGNFFCLACPFMLTRNLARRLFQPRFNWPRRLRNKWTAIGLFVAILFAYELFDLWSSPWWTAWLIVGYFLAVLAVDGVFKHASFCKFVCPIGQFNFVASLLSPLEVRVRNHETCSGCATKDCIRGKRGDAPEAPVLQRGCELALFQPLKAGNMDCTFCLDCVHACPHDNVGIMSRMPADELMGDPPRSGIGLFSRRKDLSALAVVFTFGALLNAFGMVSPVYLAEKWLARAMHVSHELPVLGVIFGCFLVLEPIVLLGLAGWLARMGGSRQSSLLRIVVRYSYALVPLGFGMWIAHYAFHFLAGILTFVPVAQSAVASLGWNILGSPHWTLTGIPVRFIRPLELCFIGLGLAGSLLVAYRLAKDDSPEHPVRIFFPWAVVCLLLCVAAVWLLLQPMEMRATLMMG